MRRLLAACSLVFLLPSAVRASSPFLSEIAWAGSSASLADEWVEICAAPGTDLSGWSIEGAAGSPIVLPDGSAAPASGAFLVANYAADDPKSTLAAAPHLVTTAVSLSNSALALALRDATGVVVDTAGDGGAPEAGSNAAPKASMERVGITTWMTTSTSSGFDDGAAELGTPGSCASFEEASAPDLPAREDSATSTIMVPEPEPAHDAATEPSEPPASPMAAIRVSEIYPSPLSGEKEWL